MRPIRINTEHTETKTTTDLRNRMGSWLAALFLVVSFSVLVFSFSATVAKAGKPGGGGGNPGGGTETSVPCVDFGIYDPGFLGGDLLNDDWASEDPGTPYCNDTKAKIQVSFTTDGHFSLDTNNSNKASAGRDLYIDFGVPIAVLDADGVPILVGGVPLSFTTTDELDALGIEHDVNLGVGWFQSGFDMFSMAEGDSLEVNMHFNLFLRGVATVFVKLAPAPLDNNRHCPASDPVVITRLPDDTTGKKQWLIQTGAVDVGGNVVPGASNACVSHDPFSEGIRPVDGLDQLCSLEFEFVVTE